MVAREGFYILTGNDAIIYFWSAANRVNLLILSHVQLWISFLFLGKTPNVRRRFVHQKVSGL